MESDQTTGNKTGGEGARRVLRIAGMLLLVVALAGAWRNWDGERIREWQEQAGPIPFFLAMTILPAVGVPTTPLYILAGAAFSMPVALVGTLLSVAANLLLSYWVAHGALRPWLERLLEKSRHDLPDVQGRNAWWVTCLVRLAPGIPAFIKNYLLGLANIPLPIYFLGSMGITGLYAALFVVLGESMKDRDTHQALWVVGLMMSLVGVGWWVRRHLWTPDTPPRSEDRPSD
jgi:uncharacterized membrane protein YdjX (TVP38/TMEM64 family)